MSFSSDLSRAAIEMVVSLLLPLIVPTLEGDADAATSLALEMLAEYRPMTVRELRLAGEIIGFSLNSLHALAQAADRDVAAEKLSVPRRWACSLSRSGHQAQRKFDEMQRQRHEGVPEQPAPDAEAFVADAEPAAAPRPALEAVPPPLSAEPLSDMSPEEAAYASAAKLLRLMQAQYKGAPPPHSQAAQQIQAQQRAVDTARLKLEHARQRQARPELSQAPKLPAVGASEASRTAEVQAAA